ncbi:MAG: TatD family hydrolase [Tannerella sp.]|jgi:TatD DNase family protein|nr:TatD family hydrolase [Tannerella sp.]
MDKLYDTHFHLDLQESRDEILDEIERNKIYTIAVTNLPPLYEKLKKEINSKYIKIVLGLHPELICQYSKYIPDMWRLLPDAKYIGEVGIDLKTQNESKKLQIVFFEELIERCGKLGKKILSIHSRMAASNVISIIGEDFNGKVILHWYSGSEKVLMQAINSGYYFSVNYSMLCSTSGRKVIMNIPDDKVLIETDSPFTFMNKKIFRPIQIPMIIEGIAKIKNKNTEQVKNDLWNNFVNLISNKQGHY